MKDNDVRPISFDSFVGQREVIAVLRRVVSASRSSGRACGHLLVMGGPGLGKCLGEGTLITMADGHTMPVEQIVTGDRLMGPDGKVRRVLGTTTDVGPLYRIEPTKGEPWVCNDVHVLTLVNTNTSEVIDIPLNEYLNQSDAFQAKYKQFSVGVDRFEDTPPATTRPIDPYFLGVWFGDGTKAIVDRIGGPMIAKVAISKPDEEIRLLCMQQAEQWGLRMKTYDTHKKCPTYTLVADEGEASRWETNRLLQTLRNLVGPNVKIPDSYLRAPRADRLQFLAGLLDTDAEMVSNVFTISQKRKDWARAIWWLARSLGFFAAFRKRKASCRRADGSIFTGKYWVVSISGDTDQIPTRIARKKAAPRQQVKCATRTGIRAIPMGEGRFYGFELDGDGRFLLGDFTVTHNTSLAQVVANEMGVHMTATVCPAIKHRGELTALLTGLGPRDVLFLDEIHGLDRKLQELLYTALEDGVIDLTAGRRMVRLPLQPFTLIGATTHAHKLTGPLRDRFAYSFHLTHYNAEDLGAIAAATFSRLHLSATPAVVTEVGRRSRGTPRVANRLVRACRDFMESAGLQVVTPEVAGAVFEALGVDSAGLVEQDRAYLRALLERGVGIPMGVAALATQLGIERGVVEGVVEPWLVESGFVWRTKEGRVATPAAVTHLQHHPETA
jgi:holliday junction DNA helicase RuvB